MTRTCVYCGVNATLGGTRHFFGFPFREPEVLQVWIERTNLSLDQVSRSSKLCSDHFEKSCLSRTDTKYTLLPGSLPTIFGNYKSACAYCQVKKSDSKTRTFHKFPFTRTDILQKWVDNIPLPDFKPSERSILCSDHFDRSCFYSRGTLKPSAVPSIFFPIETEVPPATVLTFPGVTWNPDEENDEESARTIPSENGGEWKYDPDVLLRNSIGSSKRPDLSTLGENEEVHESQTYSADSFVEREEGARELLLEKLRDELCRICGKKEEMLLPICGEDESAVGEELTLAKKVEMYLPLEINVDEYLPLGICAKCHELLESWHELYVSCSAADSVLREVFGVVKGDDALDTEERGEETTVDEEEMPSEVLGSECEEAEAGCEGVKMRSEKENDPIDDNMQGADLFDDNLTIGFKKQHRVKCYSTKRGIAEVREICISPEKEVANTGENRGSLQPAESTRSGLAFRGKCKELQTRGTETEFLSSKPAATLLNRSRQQKNWKSNIKEERAKYPTLSVKPEKKSYISMIPLNCPYCKVIFTDWEEYKRHKKKCRLEPTVCESCGTKLSRRCYLKNHVKKTKCISRKVTELRRSAGSSCGWCHKIFKSNFALRHHIDVVHNSLDGEKMPTDYCEPCCRVFMSPRSYRIHMRRHEDGTVKNCVNLELLAADGDSEELFYNCPVCGVSFPNKMQVIVHMNAMNVKKCPSCRVRMSTERCTFIHKCKYWYCRFCNKQFYNKNRFEIHERVHTRERPYMCHICGKKLVSSESLFTHSKVHGKPVYKCEVCGKLFRRKILFNMHMDSHAGKHNICLLCDKHFLYPSNLSKHYKRYHREILDILLNSRY